MSNSLVNSGSDYSIPTNTIAGEYTLSVQGRSSDGTCLTDFTTVNFSVNHPGVTYTPLYNSSNFTKTIDLSKPVGTVAGSSGVSASGGATYSIPIYTPPGTNGIQPSISIVYNSQGRNSIVGYGWNVSGLSIINRVGKNLFHNDIVSPVTNTNEDAFVLDGIRLNPISGSNGANLTAYSSENETFSRIISYGPSSNNPGYFEVIAKDGSKMEFGNTVDSKMKTDDGQNTMLWRLNKITDIYGNYIDFKYENGFRDSRIVEIIYTGNLVTGMQPYNKIKFNYEVRSDKSTVFDAGASMTLRHLLTSITITNEGNTIKTYSFKHGSDNINSFLKEINETGAEGTALNSTIFLYGDQPQVMGTQSTINFTGEAGSGDFNGDGKSDILATYYYYDNNGIRFNSGYKIITDPSIWTALYEKNLPPGHTVVENKKISNFIASDLNMDGRDDILLVNTSLITYPSGYIGKKIEKYTLAYSTNTGYTESDLPITPHKYIHENGNYIVLGDFDGDTNMDYITMLGASAPSGGYTYKAFFTNPSKFILNKEINGFYIPIGGYIGAINVIESDRVVATDFNGDGKQELLITKGSQTFIMSIVKSGTDYNASIIYTTNEIVANSKIFQGDFNGDSKNDYLVRNTNGTWKLLYSTGTSYLAKVFSFNQVVNITGSYSDDKVLIADYNGDGKSDILHGYNYFQNGVASTSRLSLYYGKSHDEFLYEQYIFNGLLPYVDLVAGDFNGDGRSDILSKNSYTSEASIIYFKANGTERLLRKITNGHNLTVDFNYKLLTDKSVTPYVYNRTVSLDDPNSRGLFNYIQLPINVLSTTNSPNGIGGINTIAYGYENAVLHRGGKGFLGFLKVILKDNTNGITTTTENEINSDFAVSYTKKQSSQFTATGDFLAESTNNTSFVNLSTGISDPKRFFMRNDKILTVDHITEAATENTNTYDNYGNITSSTAKIGALSGTTVNAVETVVTTTTFGTFNTPFPARPTSITASKTRIGASAQGSTTTFNYNTNGSLASQTLFSGLPKSVTTSYSYNSFGNITSVSVASAGLATRTSNAVFDSKGRFAVTKSVLVPGSLPIIESITYDSKWGQPLTLTSGDCLTTLFEYDAFGRPKKTTLPTGVFATNSLVWDVQNGNVFYSFSDYSGGKPDTKQWHDVLGRPTKMQVAGFNNQWLTQLSTYNAKGNVSSQTNTYYPSESPVTTTFSYDAYNRVTNTASPVSSVSTSYMKLSNGQFQVVTSNSAGQSTTKITDASGKVVQSIDNGGLLNFFYDSRGNQLSVTHGSNIMVSSTYDVYGNQTTLTDKNAGTISYQYDAFGQLTQQTDNLGNTYTMNYDVLGRIINKQGPEGATTYEYYYNAGNGCRNNNIVKVTGFNGVLKEFTYDAFHRMTSEKLTVDGIANTTQYAYNNFSQLTQTIYPSGIAVNNSFDNNGNLLTVSGGNAGSPVTLFTATGMNGFGQYTNYSMGNGKSSEITYNYGIPTRYYTQGVQDLNLNFNYTTGNLTSRYDAIKNLTENFQYDNLNRFNTAAIGNNQQLNVNYDQNGSLSMGNIVSKTDAGNYVYKNDKLNAVAYITNPAGATALPVTNSTHLQQITYTPFLKTATVSDEGVDNPLVYTYGPDYQRVKSEIMGEGGMKEILYLGNYEKLIQPLVNKEIHYVAGGDGLCAIIVKENNAINYYFVYKDHLGSLLTLTNINGNVVAEQNFDAWGRKRNPVTWQYTSVPSVPDWLYRGYTGHEHLPQFALINMNGRMYDPVQGRMLSPDNYVMPTGTQGYNRYSYANNNPLTYTDPSGEIIVPILIGAAIGLLTNGINNSINNDPFFQGAGRAALIGGISGAFSFGVGQAVTGVNGFAKLGLHALAHGHLGGIMSTINGGTYGQGFLSGAAGSLIGGGANSLLQNAGLGWQAIGTVGSGALAGKIAAEIAGGNFWDGARNGAISAGLNHAYHSIQTETLKNQLQKVFDNYPTDGNDEISVQEAFSRVNPAAEKLHLSGNAEYQNACATRLSLAFAKAGVNIPNGYGGLKDINGNRIIISAKQMYNFMSTKYGSLMTKYSSSTSTRGIYIGLTRPGMGYTGHVTIIKPGFNSNTYSSSMNNMYFWSIH